MSRAVKRGALERGVCVGCGSVDNIEGHHEDYTDAYNVVWLCCECHRDLHIERSKAAGVVSKDRSKWRWSRKVKESV